MKTEGQFWARVDRTAGETACWPWTGAVNRDPVYASRSGYGMIQWRGKMIHAQRLALILSRGEPPVKEPKMLALHLCDNPPCCNPAHLAWGTPAENMRQMDDRGRRRPWHPIGEKNPKAKLTADQVAAIRQAHPATSQADLARQYGVRQVAISRIVRGVTWE